MNITVQIVFSGLILLASEQQPPMGKHAALLVDEEHFGSMFLRSGSVISGDDPDACQRVQHSRGCLLWELEVGGPWEIYFPQVQQRSALRMVGRSTQNGKPVAVPKVPYDVEDTEWMPSLSKLSGPYGLDEGCYTGAGEGCGGGLAARFVIPGGRIKTCHLAHLPDKESKVLLAFFPQTSIPPRAISNAFINTFQVAGDSLKLCRKRTSGSAECVEIKPHDGIIRLLVRNEQGNLCDQVADEVKYEPHYHFAHFYPMLTVNNSGPVPELDDQWAVDAVNGGECEEDLAEIDDIEKRASPAFIAGLKMAWQQQAAALRSADDSREAITFPRNGAVTLADVIFYCTNSVPHSTSQCDTSTYP